MIKFLKIYFLKNSNQNFNFSKSDISKKFSNQLHIALVHFPKFHDGNKRYVKTKFIFTVKILNYLSIPC